MLADVDTGQSVADLSSFADHRNDVSFHNNGESIYFQRDRWDFEITRFNPPLRCWSIWPSLPSLHSMRVRKLPHLQLPPSRFPAIAIDASDLEKLGKMISKPVVVYGKIAEITSTATGGHFNILMDPATDGIMLFLRNNNVGAFNEKFQGDVTGMILGKTVIVRGTLVKYGGTASSFNDRVQIELTDPAQLSLAGNEISSNLPTLRWASS